MPGPSVCVSSYFTSLLLTYFRNELGSEENWIRGRERINNIYTHVARVAITELAVSVLCVSAAIETIAYGILMVGSLTLYPLTSKPLNYSFEFFSSSLFTVVWNFANATTFNPFYINTITQESFARFSLDHSERGEFFYAILRIMYIALVVLSIFFGGGHVLNDPFIGPSDSFSNGEFFTRTSDIIRIAEWCRTHHLETNTFGNLPDLPERLRPIVNRGRGAIAALDAGKRLMTEHLFVDGQVHPETRSQIIEFDAAAFLFALQRIVYACVYIEPNAQIDFFSAATQIEITNLRSLYQNHQDNRERDKRLLERYMYDLNAYSNVINPDPILISLKGIGYYERGDAISIRCLQNAINDYNNQAHPEP